MGRVVASSSSLASELFSLPASAREYGPWRNRISVNTTLPYQKRYPSALKGLQEGSNVLHHNSEPIILF